MGDLNIKECIESVIPGSSLILKQSHQNAPSKHNIILMNPEIHIHDGGTKANNNEGASINNNALIKKLQEEMKVKQDEIEREREMNQMLQYENALIRNRNEMLYRHVALRNVHGASEPRNEMESEPVEQQNYGKTKRKRKQRKINQIPPNGPYNGSKNPVHRGHTRSKTNEMEFWQWNGKDWINTISNSLTQIRNQVSTVGSEQCDEQADKISVVPPQPNRPSTSGANNRASSPEISEDMTLSSEIVEPSVKETSMTLLQNKKRNRPVACDHVPNLSISTTDSEIINLLKCDECKDKRPKKS